ncbi:MAG: hypothetical protein QOI38_3123 [Sphingomonadales bacterium]|nr:hypothetical protein [Sphingomonadales bacterium]
MPQGRKGRPLGKLKAVARRWAGGRGGTEEAEDDALTSLATLPQRAEPTGELLELAPDEAGSAGLFFALDTQWRRCAMTGQRLGLDYQAIEPTARLMGIEITPMLLPDLTIMEKAAIDELARRRR